MTEQIGQTLKWLVLFSSLISAGVAVVRYGLHTGSNAWLEIQWYMFAAMFLIGAGYALKYDEHVRVDALFSRMSPTTQAWVDVFGGILFLMPTAIIIGWLGIPMVVNSWRVHEYSNDPGGLLRWPVKIMIPIGFALLALQGLSDIIKKYQIARGWRTPGKAYERPVQ
ncbi:MAG: TRAP transporter small permease subunit [Pseudorhodoplanes sp.]